MLNRVVPARYRAASDEELLGHLETFAKVLPRASGGEGAAFGAASPFRMPLKAPQYELCWSP